MTDKNEDALETQQKIAEKLNAITVRRIAVEQMEEQNEEFIEDLVHLYKECGNKKSKGEVKLLVDVYVDAEKAKNEEEVKIDRAKLRLTKVEEAKEELSVFDRFRLEDPYTDAEEYLDV